MREFVKQNFYTSIIGFTGNMFGEKEFFDELLAHWSTLCNTHDGLIVLLEYLMVTFCKHIGIQKVFLLLSSVINDAQILHVGFTMTKLWPLAVKSV